MKSQELPLLDQSWSWLGTLKLLSYIGVSVLCGYFWYAVYLFFRWVLRVFGVNV